MRDDVQTLARSIEAHVEASWRSLLEQHSDKLARAYAKAGDMAYGTYLDLLYRPVRARLREAGLRASPRLPGDFQISREWGNADQSDQQRWMWSTIARGAGQPPLGTIVTVVHHDHTRFRVPRAPGIIGLTEVGREAVVEALSRRSADFRDAREASVEIAEYLAGLERQGAPG